MVNHEQWNIEDPRLDIVRTLHNKFPDLYGAKTFFQAIFDHASHAKVLSCRDDNTIFLIGVDEEDGKQYSHSIAFTTNNWDIPGPRWHLRISEGELVKEKHMETDGYMFEWRGKIVDGVLAQSDTLSIRNTNRNRGVAPARYMIDSSGEPRTISLYDRADYPLTTEMIRSSGLVFANPGIGNAGYINGVDDGCLTMRNSSNDTGYPHPQYIKDISGTRIPIQITPVR